MFTRDRTQIIFIIDCVKLPDHVNMVYTLYCTKGDFQNRILQLVPSNCNSFSRFIQLVPLDCNSFPLLTLAVRSFGVKWCIWCKSSCGLWAFCNTGPRFLWFQPKICLKPVLALVRQTRTTGGQEFHESQFKSINIFVQSYDYTTITLIKRKKKIIISVLRINRSLS